MSEQVRVYVTVRQIVTETVERWVDADQVGKLTDAEAMTWYEAEGCDAHRVDGQVEAEELDSWEVVSH